MFHPRKRPLRSRLTLLTVIVAGMAAAFASTAAAANPTATTGLQPSAVSHNSGYAFTQHDVMVRRTALRWALNRIFPDFAPVDVTCWGLNPVSLRSGGTGFRHVRCTTGLNIPDFVYHLDRNGDFFVTRSW
jgi:hypothetical protein